jgi:hypothetical protein
MSVTSRLIRSVRRDDTEGEAKEVADVNEDLATVLRRLKFEQDLWLAERLVTARTPEPRDAAARESERPGAASVSTLTPASGSRAARRP